MKKSITLVADRRIGGTLFGSLGACSIASCNLNVNEFFEKEFWLGKFGRYVLCMKVAQKALGMKDSQVIPSRIRLTVSDTQRRSCLLLYFWWTEDRNLYSSIGPKCDEMPNLGTFMAVPRLIRRYFPNLARKKEFCLWLSAKAVKE